MATRKELIQVVRARYRSSARMERQSILEEFLRLTGYHRKHAIRVLGAEPAPARDRRRPDRLYDEDVRQALIVLWEAADRICGKRLKALLPALVDAMERHGRLSLAPGVKGRLLAMSPATIDRALSGIRVQAYEGRRRRPGASSAVRRAVPVRTFADWKDPEPGHFEVDLVEHCGGLKQDGNFVHSLVLTDIATGWTECQALPVREQTIVTEALARVRSELPFALRGIDTDNDSAFMNETVLAYCRRYGLAFTRSRPYKKNDQAWVEQKNGSIVRRLVGYGRLSGLAAAQVLACLYSASRLYVNFFQPSFKLKSKTRTGAHVSKRYYPPLTPYERVLAASSIDEAIKGRLRAQFAGLDPVALLQAIREAQKTLADLASRPVNGLPLAPTVDVGTFLEGLSTAWKSGEVRPTHRKVARPARWWRTRVDPFERSWPTIEKWLEAEAVLTAKEIMKRLAAIDAEVYGAQRQLRTLQRRVAAWRHQRANELVLGTLGAAVDHEGAAAAAPS